MEKKLKRNLKRYKRKKDYINLFEITQKIISERKNFLREKVNSYIEEYKKYIGDKKILSEKELDEISFLTDKLNFLSREYDDCSKLEEKLTEKDVYGLANEAENQLKKYFKEKKEENFII
jgi:hypothetical protein